MRKSCKLAFAIITAIIGINGQAQVSTGTPWHGSFGGGPDVINLGNLNVNWTFPLINKPGRGIPFVFAPTYDSSIWYPLTSNGVTTWQPVANWGWSGLPGAVGGTLTYSTTVVGTYSCGPTDQYQHTVTLYSNYVYTDTQGTQHVFGAGTTHDEGNCYPGQVVDSSTTATATDGQGYTLNAYPAGGTVTTPSGIGVLMGNAVTSFGSGFQEDSNGNYISVSNNVYTDTLGTQVMSASGNTITANGPSGNVTYQITYKQYVVQTAFNCPNNSPGDYGPTQLELVDKIILPDSRFYQFFYEPTPNGSGNVTGRISGVKLPTDSGSGPTISYTYSGGDSGTGIVCADGSTAGLTRTTPDGTWTYNRKPYGASWTGTQWTTTVTAPAYGAGNAQDQAVIAFLSNPSGTPINFYEISRQTYSGSSTSGTLLKTILSCFSDGIGNNVCPNQAGLANYPVTSFSGGSKKDVKIQYPDKSGISSGYYEEYDSTGLVSRHTSSVQDHITVHTQLGTVNDPITGATIQNAVRTLKDYVYDNAGSLVSYVEYGLDGGTTQPSGASQHSATACSGNCGNITSVKTWISGGDPVNNGIASSGTKYLTSSSTYYDTGLPITTTDVNNNQTTYTYGSGSCNYAFATTTSTATGGGPVASLQTSAQWNCNGGVPSSTIDMNGNMTSYDYGSGPYWRPMSVTNNSTSAVTNYTYPSSSSNSASVWMSFNNGSSVSKSVTSYDPLGRAILQQKSQGALSSGYDSVAIRYDSRGRVASQTLPYSAALGVYLPSNAGTTTVYDTLGRTLQVTDAGKGYVAYNYNGWDVLRTVGPQATGENLKKQQLEYNDAGWLTSVCEITSGTLAAPAGQCSQGAPETGYFTQYGYDGAGRVTQIKQNAQSGSSGAQTRTFNFDGLGRMIKETIPEWSAGTGTPGTSSYTYDNIMAGSNCAGNSPGDLLMKVDNAGNVTCFTYDGLHRPLSSQVVAGPYQGVTPEVHAVYDAATYNGAAMTNVMGSVAEAYTCPSGNCSSQKLTDTFFSVSPITSGSKSGGVLAQMWESTPNSSGYFLTQDTYYPNGVLGAISAQLGSTSILPSLGYTLDGEGRPYAAIDATNCQNLVAATSYNASSSPTSIVYGNASTGSSNNDIDSFLYDPNTGRPTQFKYSVNAASNSFNVTGNLTWHPNGELNQLALTDTSDPTKNQTCVYSNDDLNRIASVNCGSNTWAQSFTYDAFGNINKDAGTNTGTSYKPGVYNAATNQIPPSSFATYDPNGNQLQNSLSMSFAWNAAGQPVNVNGVAATYDALGRMVEIGSGSTSKQIVYRPSGDKLALVQVDTAHSSVTLMKGTIPLPGGATAVYSYNSSSNSSTLSFIRHTDWLGSARLATTWNHAVYAKEAYAPFGEPYNETSTVDRSFTGQDQDTSQGVYDYLFRRYDPTAGRWLSPDPYNGSYDFTNPQSLNRYSFVLNNPLRLIDPSGLDGCSISTIYTEAECTQAGGTWSVGQDNTTVNPGGCSNSPDPDSYCMQVIYSNGPPSTTIDPLSDGDGLIPGAWSTGVSVASSSATDYFSGGAFAPSNGTPWYKNPCVTGALASNAANLAIDTAGAVIPGVKTFGTLGRIIGAERGYATIGRAYQGIVADQIGAKAIKSLTNSAAGASGLASLTDTSALGLTSTALTAVGLFTPFGQIASVASLGVDAYKTYKAVSACYSHP